MKPDVSLFMKNKLIPALLSIALGVVLIIARRSALDVMVKITGGLIAAGGVAFILAWLFRRDKMEGTAAPMLVGPALVMILIGLAMIFFSNTVVDIFPIIMGIILILNGLSHLAAAGLYGEDRILIGLLGIITIVLGVLIVAQPDFVANALMVWIGAFFIVNGVFDLFVVKRVSGSTPDSSPNP